MKTSKNTLLIDGNHFVFKTFSVVKNYLGTNIKFMGSKEHRRTLVEKLATDFAYEFRKFSGVVDNVVFVIDSKSWRKDFYPDADYKGNREKSEDIDWDGFTDAQNIFIDRIKELGVIPHRVPGAEGDDLLFGWSSYLNSIGVSTIIMSGDRDMIQLANWNKSTNSHTLVYQPCASHLKKKGHKDKLYGYLGFNEYLKESDSDNNIDSFFEQLAASEDSDTRWKDAMNDMISEFKIESIDINAHEYAFVKVLTGDSGDNIKSIYEFLKKTKKGVQVYTVTEKKAQAILDDFKEKKRLDTIDVSYFYNQEYAREIALTSHRILNVKGQTPDQIKENIILNANLILLNKKSIPDSILDAILKSIEKVYLKDVERNHFIDYIALSHNKTILEGTVFEDKSNNTSVRASIFSDDENETDDDMSFIID